jgi:hypothetical protein
MIAFAWYVWEHGHEGPPTIGFIEPLANLPRAKQEA